MLSKCANPPCTARFRFLHEGIVFRVLRAARPRNFSGDVFWENTNPQRVERYWLCDHCSRLMTLVRQGGAVVLKLLPGNREPALSHRPEFARMAPFPP